MLKVEFNKNDFLSHSLSVKEVIEKNHSFLFYFSPDPDAIGVSIAFSLHLKSMNKKSYIYIPKGFDYNLEFLIDIAIFNDINVINTKRKLMNVLKKEKLVFITCDTPTYRLLPDYEVVLSYWKENFSNLDTIEIDHHFGGDSEQIYPNSKCLFFQANSCCDIFADYLYTIGKYENERIDIEKYFPRNVVLSLLVGMCYDTQYGKFLINNHSYDHWFNFLSERLSLLTWSNGHLKTASEVFETITKMSESKIKLLNQLVNSAEIINGVGCIVLPKTKRYESLSPDGDPSCIISKITSDLANLLPEKAGKVGIIGHYDDIKSIYLIKMRRSAKYKDFDLRDLERYVLEDFKEFYIGGGGHPGAVSFRIKNIEKNKFQKMLKDFFYKVVELVP